MRFALQHVLAALAAASSAAASGYVGSAYNTTDCSNPGGFSQTGFYNETSGAEPAGTCYPAHTVRALSGGIKSVKLNTIDVPDQCCLILCPNAGCSGCRNQDGTFGEYASIGQCIATPSGVQSVLEVCGHINCPGV